MSSNTKARAAFAAPSPHKSPRRNEPERLLFTRKQTAYALGGVSMRIIKELEQSGELDQVRLTKKPTAQVFHRAAQVRALAEAEEARDDR